MCKTPNQFIAYFLVTGFALSSLAVAQEYPEKWASATPPQLIQIAKNRKFEDLNSPLLQRLAVQFSSSATPEDIDELADEYFTATPAQRNQMCLLLRDVSSPPALHALVELTKEKRTAAAPPSDPLLKYAARSLWSHGNRPQLEWCLEMMFSGSPSHQSIFSSALPESLSPELLPFISEIVISGTRYSGNTPASVTAAMLLGRIPCERSRDMLRMLEKSPDESVSRAAVEASDRLKLTSPNLYQVGAGG